MFWDRVRLFFTQVDKLPKLPFALMGLGLARSWLWQALDNAFSSPVFSSFSSVQTHLIFDLGEIAGFLLLALFARKFSPYFKRPFVLVSSILFISVYGIATIIGIDIPLGPVIELLVLFLGGFGYSFLFLLWLEVYGCLSTRNMVIAWTGSYLLGFLFWLVFFNNSTGLSSVATIITPFIVAVMLLRSFFIQPDISLPKPFVAKPGFPIKIALGLSAFAFAFGAGDIVTGEFFAVSDKIGMGIPNLAVLLGIIAFSKWFNLRHLITAASIMIAAATMVAFFVENNSLLSIILYNASAETYLILSYTIGCSISRQLNISSVYICGIFAGLYKIFLQLGKISSTLLLTIFQDTETTHSIVGAIIVLSTITASIILVQDQDIIERFSIKQFSIGPLSSANKNLSEYYNLTPKETSVFILLSKGLDTVEIAEEMFLAPSTVRVHISSIYKKLGVHSKRDLEPFLENCRNQII